MTLVWTRIDQKLIHGQISLAWVPHLRIEAIVVADREMTANPRGQRCMKLGLPPEVAAAYFVDPKFLCELLDSEELQRRRVLLLFRDLAGVVAALDSGLKLTRLNLGFYASSPLEPATRLGDAFYVGGHDLAELHELYTGGLELILQAIPTDKAVRWAPQKTET